MTRTPNQAGEALKVPDRILRRIKRNRRMKCWIWTGPLRSGYGYVYFKGKNEGVHRIMYESKMGKIPVGLEIDHLCRNRKCVNPKHLEAVTHRENLIRGLPKPKKVCDKGHRMRGDNIKINYRGSRKCYLCFLIKEANFRKRHGRGLGSLPDRIKRLRKFLRRIKVKK